ncbi:MAG TPA: diguanylate cyclase [bacterium]|nr:diguanylate cyclase [bacterium]
MGVTLAGTPQALRRRSPATGGRAGRPSAKHPCDDVLAAVGREAERLAQPVDLVATLEDILTNAQDLVIGSASAVWLRDSTGTRLSVKAHRGYDGRTPKPLPLDAKHEDAVARVLATGRPCYTTGARGLSRRPGVGNTTDFGAILPLRVDGHLVGVLTIERPDRHALSAAARKQLTVFAALASLAVYQAQQQDLLADRDRTARELSDSAESFASLFNATTEGIVIHDQACIVAVNQTFAAMSGYTLGELIGKNALDLAAPEYRPLALDNIRANAAEPYDIVAMRKDGSTFPAELAGRPMRFQGRFLRMVTVRDISKRKQAEELARVGADLSEALQVSLSVEEASTVVSRFCMQAFPGASGAIVLNNGSPLTRAAAWGPASTLLGSGEFVPEDCWALRRGRPHLVSDSRTGLLCKHVSAPGPPAYQCIPLIAQGETLGVLCLTAGDKGTKGELTPAVARLAKTMADHLSLALANLRLREALRAQSVRDPLTGLFNRRYLEETLEREFRRSQRAGSALSIIMFDVDHFKQFNDRFGHDVGDTLLRHLADLARSQFRSEDIVCRYGGEEFVVVLPAAGCDDARARAETLWEVAAALRIAYGSRRAGEITISLGVATIPDHGSNPGALLHAADVALYRAKQNGRDRVETATPV